MHAERRILVPLATTVLLAVAGLAEAVRLHELGLAIVLGAAIVTAVITLVALHDRTAVGLRADLADWAEQTCAASGEMPERLIDRAVSSYRSQLDATASTPERASPEVVTGDG